MTDRHTPTPDLKAFARAGWGLADQAVSSLTNFALTVIVARSVAPRLFGAYAIVLAAYMTMVGIGQALGSEPLVVRYTASDPRKTSTSAAASACGFALVLGLALSGLTYLTSLGLGGILGRALLPLCATIPGLLLQDAYRFVFFAGGQPRKAFVNDILWGIGQIGGTAWVLHGGHPSVATLVWVWGGAGTVAALVAVLQAQVVPAPMRWLSWIRTTHHLSARYLGEFAASSGVFQVTLYVVGGIAGLAAAGALRAGQAIFGPIHVLFSGARVAAVPEMVRLGRTSPKRLKAIAQGLSLSVGLAAAGWTVAVLALPQSVGVRLFGASWMPAHPLLWAIGAQKISEGLITGSFAGLRTLAAAVRGLRARMFSGGLSLIGGTVGGVISGAYGAVVGLAVAQAIGVAVWWRQFLAAERETYRLKASE